MIAASWMTLRDQSQLIFQRLTETFTQLRASLPIVERVWPSSGEGGTDGLTAYVVGFARSATTAAGMIVLALALTVYFLIEWKPTLDWTMAFVPERAPAESAADSGRGARDRLPLRGGKCDGIHDYRHRDLCRARMRSVCRPL